jgi:putative addiction module component (TIGR02574 family)
MRATDIPQFTKLSPSEKILLAEDIWDSVSANDASVPIPESHKRELDRRARSAGRLLTIEQLQARIDSRK